MIRVVVLSVAMVLAAGPTAHAEYLEIQASQIVTIASRDRSVSPRVLVQWSLPDSLAGKIIDGAAVQMPLARSGGCEMNVGVFPLTRNWQAETVDWESGWGRAGGEYNDSLGSPAVVTERTGGKITANLNDMILDHIAGRKPNCGFILIPEPNAACKLEPIVANDISKRDAAKLIIAFRNQR